MNITKQWIGILLIIVIIIGSFPLILNFLGFGKSNTNNTINPSASCSPIHWHPKLRIIINGQEQIIPSDIGIRIGKIMDTDLSGMVMSPTHTHDAEGTIHMENNCPDKKPESYTLGYFFKVWDKKFDESCIFEYCNVGTKKVSMTVNGQPNNEFGNYKTRDGDQIEIRYGD